jgi:hypothetical protein
MPVDDIRLTDTDLAEAIQIAAAAQIGRPHPQPEPRHILAAIQWGARCEQEASHTEQRIAGFEEMLAAVKRAVEREVPNE